MPWFLTINSSCSGFTIIDEETQQETFHYDIIKPLPSISSTRSLQHDVDYISTYNGEQFCCQYLAKQNHILQYNSSSSSSNSHSSHSSSSSNNNNQESMSSPTTPISLTSFFPSFGSNSETSQQQALGGGSGDSYGTTLSPLSSQFGSGNSLLSSSSSASSASSFLLNSVSGKRAIVESSAVLVKDRTSNELLVIKPVYLKEDEGEDFETKFQQFEKLKAISLSAYNVVRLNRLFKFQSNSSDDDSILSQPMTSEFVSASSVLARKKKSNHLTFVSMEYCGDGDFFQIVSKYQKIGKKFSLLSIYNFLIQIASTLSGMTVKQSLSTLSNGGNCAISERISIASSSEIDDYVQEVLSRHGHLTLHNILVEFEQTGHYKYFLTNFPCMQKNLIKKNVNLSDDNKENEKLLYHSHHDYLFTPVPPENIQYPEEFYGTTEFDDRWALGILLYQLLTCKSVCFEEEDQKEMIRLKERRSLDLNLVKQQLETYLSQGDFAVEHEPSVLGVSPMTKKRRKQLEEELHADAKALVDITLSLLSNSDFDRPNPCDLLQNEFILKYAKMINEDMESKGKDYTQQIENDLLIVEEQKQHSQNATPPLFPEITQKDYLSLQFFLAYHKEKGIDDRWDANFFRQERIGQESILPTTEMACSSSLKSFVLSLIRSLRLNVLFDFKKEVNLPTDYKMLKTTVLNILSLQNKKKTNVSFKHVKSFMGQALPLVQELILIIVLLECIEFLLESDFEYYSTCPLEYSSKTQLFAQILKIEGEIKSKISKHEIESSQFRIATRLAKKENEVRFFIDRETAPLATKLINGLTKSSSSSSDPTPVGKGNIVLSLLRYIVSNCFQKEHRWVIIGNEGKMEGKMFGFDDIYLNKKKRSRCSLNFSFHRDYINAESNLQIQLAFSKSGDREILFADKLDKINDKCKIQRRIFLVSDLAVYNIDPANYKVKRRVDISDIESIYVSTYTDGYFVLKVPNSYDFLYSSWRRTEIVAAIQKVKNIPIHVSNRFPFNPSKGDNRHVVFVEDMKAVKSNVKLSKKEYIVTVRPPEADPINIESVCALVTYGKSSEQKEILLDPFDISTIKLPLNASYRVKFVFYANTNLNCFLDEFIKGDNETVFQLLLGQFGKSEDKVVLITDLRNVGDYFALKAKKSTCTMKIMDTERQAIHCQQFIIEYDMQ